MSLQDIQHEKDHALHRRFVFGGGGYIASNSEFVRIINGASSDYAGCVMREWQTVGSTTMTAGTTVGYTYSGTAAVFAKEGEYDPAFVARVLTRAQQPPEAKFDNVVDMLEWLNRD